ncbi:hypothetical protein [Serpentinicella alkaliphila]|uniref:Uncharacterized protein n=1 Tax=Serpentinicella alkaliphila TaxID=1734049 RepID=A0A4R2SXP5_9FIRM|nr:hypothetical protein [Serpentinicella alkaliphila]QUH26432.1 hypothetical protein HZR23_12315 [Serpentinicella alkaliphila]TCP95267.1 hypothetical protein EDD79_10629 [Serpentinicella alkaliphila]
MEHRDIRFINEWGESRLKGKRKYVLTSAALTGTAPLLGTIFGSIILFSPLNSYSITYYVRTYFLIYLCGFIGGAIKSIYTWVKNEERYLKF